MVKRGREDGQDATHSAPAPASPTQDSDTDTAKIVHLSSPRRQQKVIECHLPPHRPCAFASYDDFDRHYAAHHSHRCSECHKNFPSEHFMSLHIAENHDPLNQARRARGDKIYACFVEDCDKVCSTWHKRKLHLVDKHLFPKEYDFFIVNDGLGRRKSMLRTPRRHHLFSVSRSSVASTPQKDSRRESLSEDGTVSTASEPQDSMSVGGHEDDDELTDLTKSMSALKFVPPSVRFGRGRGKMGFGRR